MNNVGFEQNYNIYKWRYGFDYQKKMGGKGQLFVKEEFSSSLLKIREHEKKWKDDQQLTIDYSWKFSSKSVAEFVSSSTIFSDKLSGITNDIRTSFGSIGIKYFPIDSVSILSIVGYKFDTRFDKLDHGLLYAFDMNTPFVNLNDYLNKLAFYIRGDDFTVRKNRDFNIQYQVNKKFYTDTSDSLSLTWTKKRRDNYDRWQKEDLYVESLNEEVGELFHILNYRINNWTKLRWSTNFQLRNTKVSKRNAQPVDENRAKKDFSSVNELTFHFITATVKEKMIFSYSTENLKNEVPDSLKDSPFSNRFSYVSPDFISSRLTLSNLFRYQFFNNDTLTSNFSVNLLRYDTPEETNYDDRDELTINANLSEVHYFSRHLKLRCSMGVNLKHTVFIYSEKSANNNWMRIFRLKPEIYYQSDSKFRLYQSFEVLANYVAYDFEQQQPSIDIRSYVFRKFTAENTFQYQMSRMTNFNMHYKIELEENGKFFWDKWSEILLATRQNHYWKTYFNFAFISDATMSMGFVFFKRNEQFQIIESSLDNKLGNDYISYGPSLLVNYNPNNTMKFAASFTKRRVNPVQKESYYISNVNINLSWYF